MLPIRRAAPRSLRRLRTSEASRPTRRLAHDEQGAHHAQPQTESFGRGFYLSLALVPAGFMLYTLRPTTQDAADASFLTNIIKSWREAREDVAARNALHTRLIEQAGFDKNLFNNTPSPPHIELRFPEIFNVGSPWNVPAGQGGANLDKLVEHYREESRVQEEAKLEKLRNAQEAEKAAKDSSQ